MEGTLTTVDFADPVRPKSTAHWFYAPYSYLASVLHPENLDLSQCTTMAGMFSGCKQLAELDASSWDTGAVEDMSELFNYALADGCSLNVANWNTSSVTNMARTFFLSGLQELDISGWDTRNVTNMVGMLQPAHQLQRLVLGENFQFAPDSPDHAGLDGETWYNEETWESFDGGDIPDGTEVGKTVTYVANGPEADYALVYKNGDDYALVFQHGNTPNLAYGEYVAEYTGFANDLYAVLDASDAEPGKKSVPWSEYREQITTVVFDAHTAPRYTSHWFEDQTNLIQIVHPENLDVSQTTDMGRMFKNCSSLTALDVSGWNTQSLTSLNETFYNCCSLTELDVGGFITDSCYTMYGAFYHCNQLTTLDVARWNTGNVTNMNSMFSLCTKLTTLDVSDWDTHSCTDMGYLFNNCSPLTGLDVSGFDVSHVTRMDYMFNNCTHLTELDVADWNTESLESANYMFYNSWQIKELAVDTWDLSKLASAYFMFSHTNANMDTSQWRLDALTNASSMFEAFGGPIPDMTNWGLAVLTKADSMFKNCKWKELDLSAWKATGFSMKDFLAGMPLERLTLPDTFALADDSGLLDVTWYDEDTDEAFAATEIPGNKAATYVTASVIDVVIPATLLVHVASDGDCTVSDGLYMVNHGRKPATITGVEAKMESGWILADWDAPQKTGEHTIALQMAMDDGLVSSQDGQLVTSNTLPSIAPGDPGVSMIYQAHVPVQYESFSGPVMSVVFTIGY